MRTFCSALALLVAGACSRSSDEPSPKAESTGEKRAPAVTKLTETEPNDSRDQAQHLSALPVVIRGDLHERDRDLYTFTVEESGGHLLHARVDRPGIVLRVSKEDGSEIVSAVSPERVAAAGMVKGRWYVTVESAPSDEDDAGPSAGDVGGSAGRGAYMLELSRSRWARGVEWEPNDRLDKAGELRTEKLEPPDPHADEKKQSIGTELAHYSVFGWWPVHGDEDCFEVPSKTVPTNAVARFVVAPPSAVRARVRVFSDGVHVADAASATAGDPAIVPALAAVPLRNPVVLCARGQAGFDAEHRYAIDVRLFEPSGAFEREPNDRPEVATTLERGKALAAYLAAGDVDWYRISGFHQPDVNIAVTAPRGVTVEALLVHPDGKTRGEGVEAEPAKKAVLRGVTPALLVVRSTSGASTEETYSLLVEVAEQTKATK